MGFRRARIHRLQDLNNLPDDLSWILAYLALPYSDDCPALRFQKGGLLTVALDVPLKLRHPIIGIVPRHREVAMRTAMPEAAVNEYGDPPPGITDVRMTRSFLPIEPIARIARVPESFTHEKLGLRPLALIAFHRPNRAFVERRFGRMSRNRHIATITEQVFTYVTRGESTRNDP